MQVFGDDREINEYCRMQPYPHTYHAAARGQSTGPISVSADSLPTLTTAPPREFDGPGDQWSPETLLCAAIADCFILTFRAIARASTLEWAHLDCHVEGILERTDQGTKFTRFVTHAQLTVSSTVELVKCRRLVEKAEQSCLVANSLSGVRQLEVNIIQQ